MTKLSDLAQRDPQHVCIFGESGSGKSTLAMSAVEAGFNLLWFSFDGGHSIFKKLDKKYWSSVELVHIPNTADNPIAITTTLAVLKCRPCKICDAHGILECRTCTKEGAVFTHVDLGNLPSNTIVVFDHLSQVSDSATNWILARRTANISDADKRAEYKMEWDDWRLQGTLMDKVLTNIQNARFNCIAIAQMRETKMEDGKKKIVPDIGTGNYSRSIGQYFDHVVYCDINNRKHVQGSSTTFNMSAVTKSRTDVEIEGVHAKQGIAAFFDPALTTEVADKEVARVLRVVQSVQTVQTQTAPEPVVESVPKEDDPAGLLETVSAATNSEAPQTPAAVVVAGSGADRAKALLAAMRGKK